jgi:tetratricopeptide (TPR) repeat protein
MQTAELWMYVAEDRRYAALWPGLTAEGRFDWRKLTEDDLARTRIRAKDEPRQLVNAYDELQLLRQLQRYDEAIALGQDYRRRLKAGDRFTDADRYANWLLNELAYALLDTGNLAEGEAVFQDAIAAREEGSPSVSQTINWAEMLNLHGRPAEALAILRTFKPESASPYGNMWVNSGLVCALGQTGGPGVPALLDTMRAHWEDNPSALSEALVCADRLDEAAEVLIRRLRSPEHRKLAIRAFRVVAPPPVLSPRQAEMERRRAAVRTRPEVQKALEAEGRAIALPLAGAYWGAV